MLMFVCLLWRLLHGSMGGPLQRPTWPEKTNPENALQDAHLYHRLPVFLHAPEPLVKSELFLPDPRKRRLPDELTALLLPTKRQHRPGQGTEDRAVEVRCGVDTVSVRVDRLQLRTRTVPSLFRLGSCEASRVSPRFLYFHYRLSECDGESKVVDGQLVYTYSLTYTPPPQGYVIRVLPLDLPIHCHYNRFLYSYQVGFKPQVTHANFLKRIRSKLIFSVTVCNAQWEPLPPGHWFILGEPVYFVVQTGNLLNGERLYVDVCYASASKDPKSLPKVDIITNYGCMTDSRREGSRSQFLSGVDNVLKFSVDSFLFKAASEVQYLHCSVSVGLTTSHNAKSCNYNNAAGRWEELEALPSVCSCCDSTCSDADDSIKNTVSSPGWFIGQKGEQKPRMAVVSFQTDHRKERVDQEEKRKERMDVRLKEVQTFPKEPKIFHEEEEEILGEKEEWNLAPISQWEKKEKEEHETEMVIAETADSLLKELATDGFIMSDESRPNEPAQVREEVPYSKIDFVIGLFSDNGSTNASGNSFSNTTISTRNSTDGIKHNVSNQDSAEDLSTAMIPITTICPDGDKVSCSSANSAVEHDQSSDGVRHGTVYVAVSEDSFSPYKSSSRRRSSVWDSNPDDGPFSSTLETVAGLHSDTSNFETDSFGFPGAIKSRKSRLKLDQFDTVLWSEQMNYVNKSDKRAEGDSGNSKGSERDNLVHIRGSESDQSARPAGRRDTGKSDFDFGREKGEALHLSQFIGREKTKKEEVSDSTGTHIISSSSVGSEHQDLPSHSAVVMVTSTLQDSETRQMSDEEWAEAVSGWGLQSLGFVVDKPRRNRS